MTSFARSPVIAVFILMVAAIAIGCSSSSPTPDKSAPQPTNGLVQSNAEGSIAIDVEWIKAGDGYLVFDVAMNTHSVELDQYDLGKLAILRDDTGNEYHPASWDSAAGGHHRQGILTFPLPDSLSQGTAKYVEVVIRDVADIAERVLKWDL